MISAGHGRQRFAQIILGQQRRAAILGGIDAVDQYLATRRGRGHPARKVDRHMLGFRRRAEMRQREARRKLRVDGVAERRLAFFEFGAEIKRIEKAGIGDDGLVARGRQCIRRGLYAGRRKDIRAHGGEFFHRPAIVDAAHGFEPVSLGAFIGGGAEGLRPQRLAPLCRDAARERLEAGILEAVAEKNGRGIGGAAHVGILLQAFAGSGGISTILKNMSNFY
jgi:hypothetical protein